MALQNVVLNTTRDPVEFICPGNLLTTWDHVKLLLSEAASLFGSVCCKSSSLLHLDVCFDSIKTTRDSVIKCLNF